MIPLASEKISKPQEIALQAQTKIAAGNPDAAQAMLEKAWHLIPLPHTACHDSMSLVRGAIRLMALSCNPALALRWISKLKNLPVSDLDPGPDFVQGVAYCELGDPNRAFEHFQRSFTMSKDRCFANDHSKYLAFYREQIAKGK